METTDGNITAAERRLDEIDDLLKDIAGNPFSGIRLSGSLEGWLVRHGGRDFKITIVFRPDADAQCLYIALVAFGGQDWLTKGSARLEFD
ncbi:MAG: hypothetical protein OXQ89_04500 [Rhodospirillaceae bacterium]|nr:hypothetical protein [Rhodospirillaceae bacterium]